MPMGDVVRPGPAPGGADFAAFYERHAAPVHRALSLTLGSPDLATDATAEAMTRAYLAWPKVARYENPAGWVYRVGLNWSISRFRKRRREVVTSPAQLPGAVGSSTASAAASLDPAVTQALAALPVEQRSVVELRYLFDWSEAETAAALGVAPGTVKSRLSRALDRLAHLLEDHHG